MIETFAAWAIIPAYLTFGVLLARSQAERVYRWRVRANGGSGYLVSKYAKPETMLNLIAIVLFWPLVFPALLGIGLLHFMYAPVASRKEKAAKLRADAAHWKREARDETDPEKKAMAQELARTLAESAEREDI